MTLLAAWMHDLDPCAVRALGRCLVRWYGLSYIAGFLVAWWIVRLLIRRGWAPWTDRAKASDLVFAVGLGAVIGGRLGYVFLYDPSLLWSFSASVPWWGVLMINHGGMASHGGMVGVIVAALVVARRDKVPWRRVTDTLALAAPPGLFFGRLANFINGELLGRVVASPGQPAPWWAVRYPQEILTGHAPVLTAAQESDLARLAAEAAPTAVSRYDQYAALVTAVQHHTGDFAARLEPLLAARHPSQLYQALAEGVVLGLVLWLIARRKPRAGAVSAAFLLVYGVLRIATEYWRLPDDHLAVSRVLGLSRGQWYSAVMILAGVILLARPGRLEKASGPAD